MRPCAKLSGGEKRRVALCRLLLSKPDMLLLDEPTNHLDAESVEWLEQFLLRFPGTVIAVTHDRYFLDNAAEWILELDRGYGIPWKGNYSSWLEQKEARLKTEAKQEAARIKAMQKELEWVRQNAKGRQAKGKARIARFEELASYEHQQRQRDAGNLHSRRRAARRRRHRICRREQGLRRAPAHRQPVVQHSGRRDRRDHRPERRRQVDALPDDHRRGEADQGQIVIGPTARLAVVDQTRESLPNDKTVFEAISGGQDILTVGRFEMPSRAYLGRFNFKGGDQQKIVGTLSGGERGRLHLAATLLEGRQRAAAGRAVERSRRRDAARARGRAGGIRRQRARHLARSLVPRSHRHAHSRGGGRVASGRSSRAITRNTRRTRRSAWATEGAAPAPHPVQGADAIALFTASGGAPLGEDRVRFLASPNILSNQGQAMLPPALPRC
jgi:ATPase subunit of ABC transporter with duplicated ATPase domains